MAARFEVVVADSSALVALATCGALELLERLVADLAVPEAVFREVVVEGKAQSEVLRNYLRTKREQVQRQNLVLETGSLGQGELEAMALAKLKGADFLLMDDERARKIASFNKIPVIGSLGVLLLAKEEGLIPRITPFLRMLRESDLFLGDALLERVRQLAEE